jgi:hypothetical protein
MDNGLIFPCRARRLNPYVCFLKPGPPTRRGGPARARAFCSRSLGREGREERTGDDAFVRTKTDTGRRGEYPKALERTVVKELGKFTP